MFLIDRKLTKFFLINLIIIVFFTHNIWASEHSVLVSIDDNQNTIVNNNIKTALLFKSGNPLSEPILLLHSSNTLTLSFDDLDDSSIKNYQYTMIHCDAEWNRSELYQSDYIEGYQNDRIINYEFSINTLTPYIHYELEFPNKNIRLTKSGNYIIQIIDADKEELILQKRFKVLDERSTINAEINPPLRISDRDNKQEVSFLLLLGEIYINNPTQEIKVVIRQNRRSYNQLFSLSPRSIQGNRLDFTYNNVSIFDGGNEYRVFDTRSLKHKSINVYDILRSKEGNTVILWPDKSRNRTNYEFTEDINGNFLIESYDGRSAEIEADYSWITFTLESDYLINTEIFIEGLLVDGLDNSENKMSYNSKSKVYKGSLFLKQGYYNYQYLTKGINSSYASITAIEDSFFETENEYSIFIYYRPLGSNYDELIGYSSINSRIK